MKKALIAKNLMDVISTDEYIRRSKQNPEISKTLSNETAIEKDGYIYPIIPSVKAPEMPNVVGAMDYGPYMVFSKPQNEEQRQDYSSDKIIDFENTNNLQDMIQKTAELERAEKSILIDKNNIYTLNINDEDTPEFALLKQAINNKQIDINSYKGRLSDSFSNNIRLLTSGNSITFGKLKTFLDVFDLEGELILRDKPDAVNPIGEELRTIL